ncbi:bZIP transcription factor ABI5 homolog isoform X1 [Typha angustifolia]|uniref:bZIP transcription factor ABI5 homolog isoform X1 n=1 Tax=Typha angustifolia TaxID=59011 RepID=UPI003C2CBA6A
MESASGMSKNVGASEDGEVTSQERGGDLEFPALVRQSSIYNLTLDEIQHTVCEPGRTFGSMNMDEFLTNIWNAEEGQAGHAAGGSDGGEGNALAAAAAAAQPLNTQGSLTIPAQMCRKTVDEVWAEIHRGQAQYQPMDRAHTFGEMTLEDFLIKAGVVREGHAPPSSAMGASAPPSAVQQQYGIVGFPMAAAGPNGYGMVVGSPVSSEGFGGGQLDNGVGYDRVNGRKRGAGEGAGVEKVVERRQRRMIKNRESAARSRARKQAYTVELEAELNQLKEENARLKEEEQRRIVALRKQMLMEKMGERASVNARRTARALRRCISSSW